MISISSHHGDRYMLIVIVSKRNPFHLFHKVQCRQRVAVSPFRARCITTKAQQSIRILSKTVYLTTDIFSITNSVYSLANKQAYILLGLAGRASIHICELCIPTIMMTYDQCSISLSDNRTNVIALMLLFFKLCINIVVL